MPPPGASPAGARPCAPGTGLGLSVVENDRAAHGGRLDILSDVGPRIGVHQDKSLSRPPTACRPPEATPSHLPGTRPRQPPTSLPKEAPTVSRVLIVEDEPRIVAFLTKVLRAAGSPPGPPPGRAGRGPGGAHGRSRPGPPGRGPARRRRLRGPRALRGQGVRTPIIMLTARSSVADRVAGLESGADDYMPKPFSFEGLARVRVRLRPTAPEAERTAPDPPRHGSGPAHPHPDAGGRWPWSLSAREFALAETFMRHPGQVLSREQLLSAVWGLDFDPGSNVVEVYVSYLRNKLGQAAGGDRARHGLPAHLIRGAGRLVSRPLSHRRGRRHRLPSHRSWPASCRRHRPPRCVRGQLVRSVPAGAAGAAGAGWRWPWSTATGGSGSTA